MTTLGNRLFEDVTKIAIILGGMMLFFGAATIMLRLGTTALSEGIYFLISGYLLWQHPQFIYQIMDFKYDSNSFLHVCQVLAIVSGLIGIIFLAIALLLIPTQITKQKFLEIRNKEIEEIDRFTEIIINNALQSPG